MPDPTHSASRRGNATRPGLDVSAASGAKHLYGNLIRRRTLSRDDWRSVNESTAGDMAPSRSRGMKSSSHFAANLRRRLRRSQKIPELGAVHGLEIAHQHEGDRLPLRQIRGFWTWPVVPTARRMPPSFFAPYAVIEARQLLCPS